MCVSVYAKTAKVSVPARARTRNGRSICTPVSCDHLPGMQESVCIAAHEICEVNSDVPERFEIILAGGQH